jgi:hypothetical protein
MGTPSRSDPASHNYSRDNCYCPAGLGYECQGHSAVVDMVELQQDGQMPVAGPGTMVDEREDGNDFADDRLSSSAFGCYQKIQRTQSSFS